MAKNSAYNYSDRNTNNSLNLIRDSLSEANNSIVADPFTRRTDVDKTGGETLAAYNLRVSPGTQPVQPAITLTYRGLPR